MFCAVFLIPVYIITFIHVKNGTNYKQIKDLIKMLLISNIGAAVSMTGLLLQLRYNCKTGLANGTPPPYFFILLLCLGEMVQDVFFMLSHWLFASKYDRLADE